MTKNTMTILNTAKYVLNGDNFDGYNLYELSNFLNEVSFRENLSIEFEYSTKYGTEIIITKFLYNKSIILDIDSDWNESIDEVAKKIIELERIAQEILSISKK